MRAVTVLSMLAVASFALTTSNTKPHITQEFVDHLNSLPGMTWRASAKNGARVTNADLNALKRLLGAKKGGPVTLPPRVFTKEEMLKELPKEFDSAKNWPKCKTIPMIRDQSDCGSCWAVAAASATSDRMCTTGTYENLPLTADNVLSCCVMCGSGCQGGYPSVAWHYWVNQGFFSEECQPYPFPHCEHHNNHTRYPPCGKHEYPTPRCHEKCTSNSTHMIDSTKYKGKTSYSVSGEEDLMRDLMLHGPIEVAFSVYSDFMTYVSGVYQHRDGQLLGGHAVRLVGWGEMNGLKYWKIANSWNTDWGMDGYFLIRRGTDECGIEDAGVAGKAS